MISFGKIGRSVPTEKERRRLVAASLLIYAQEGFGFIYMRGQKQSCSLRFANLKPWQFDAALTKWLLCVCFSHTLFIPKLITCGCPGLVNAKSTGWCRHLCRPGCDRPINISGIMGGFEPLFPLLMLQKAKWSLISSSKPCASRVVWMGVGLTLERTAAGVLTCKPWNLCLSTAQSLTPLFSGDLSRTRTLASWPAYRVPLTCLLLSNCCDLSVLMFFQGCKFPLVPDAS